MTHAEVVALLVAAYPTPGWEPPTIRLYVERLRDVPVASLKRVVLGWIDTERERPTIGELRRTATALAAGSSLSAEEAWGFVVACFTTIGSYREFPSTHPVVKQAVDAIGWQTLCLSDNQVADRAHFFRTYAAILERQVKRGAAGDLGGLTIGVDAGSKGVPQIEGKP